MEHIDIINLARKGNKEAFSKLIKIYEKDLYRVAIAMLKNDDDALDGIQDAILKAFKNIKNLKKPEYFKTWLIKILINSCNAIINKKGNIVIYENEFKNLSKLNNLSMEINEGVSDQGITVTIKEIAYDEAAFYMIYEVSADKDARNINLQRSCRVSIGVNGKTYATNAEIPLYSDAAKTTVTDVFPITGGDVLPEKFDFYAIFTEAANVKGNWNFKIPLTKQNLQDKVKTFGINKDIKDGFNNIKLMKVTSSPVYLSLLTEHKKYVPDKYDYVIMDSKGNEFEQVDMGGIVKKAFSTDVTFFYKQIEESKLDSVKVLKLKGERYSPSKLKNVQYISLDSKLPIDVSIGNNKKLTVDSICEKDNQIEIIFRAEKVPLYTFGFTGGISIYDKSLNKENKEAYDIVRPDTLGNNRYRITVSKKKSIIKDNKTVEVDRNINNLVICIGNYDEMFEELGNVDLK